MKNLTTTIVSLLGLFVISSSVIAQNVSVDPSSGTAVVTIPLHSLSYGSIGIPVNLVHSSNGVRVEESEGAAGMGWNLSCSYGVYREVRGLPDEVAIGTTKKGWLTYGATIKSFNPSSNDNLASTDYTDETADYTALNNLPSIADSEPDIYTIVGPNLYARFVYDVDGTTGTTIRLLDYQDIQITPIVNTGGFTVKNNLGHTYQFDVKEMVNRNADPYKSATVDMYTTEYEYYKDYSVPSFATAWYLSSVTDENGSAINFSYTQQPSTASTRFRTRVQTLSIPDTLYTIEDTTIPKRLSSISAGNYTVAFDWTRSNRLSNVRVSESGLGDSFQYRFTYQTVRDNTWSNGPQYLHYFLTQLDLVSLASCVSESPYRFSYEGIGNGTTDIKAVDFSWQTFFAQDFWGFYNGVVESGSTKYRNLVPRINYYDANTDNRRFTFHDIPSQTPNQIFVNATNRNTKPTKLNIGTLIRIVYPSGGYTKIDWERNTYLDSLAGKVLHGPGTRVKTLTTSGGDAAYNRAATTSKSYHDLVKTYKYEMSEADTTSSGVVFYPPVYAFASGTQSTTDTKLIRTLENQAPESRIAYRRIKELVSGQGSTVFIYSFPARYPFVTANSSDWVATKSKIARNPSSHYSMSYVKNGYYTFPFAPNPNYDILNGVLTSVTEFSSTGVMMRQKKNYYAKISPASVPVYGVRYEKITDCDCFHFSRYQINTGVGSVLTQEVVSTADDTSTPAYIVNTTNYGYNNDVANNNFLLKSVEQVLADGSIEKEYIKYVKDFAAITNPVTIDVMANAIKLMVTARRHGEVVETYKTFTPASGLATVYLDARLQLFKDFGSGKVYPYRSYSFPKGATLTPASVVPGSTQGFSYDNVDYILTASIDDYDAQSNPASITDDDRNVAGLHYAQNYSLSPIARFDKATAKQTVYDGFEFSTGRSLSATTALTYVNGWTGQRAASLSSTNTLFNNTVDNTGQSYRISCYVSAATAATITFKFVDGGGATLSTTALNYSTSGWKYLEGILPAVSLSTTQFKLTITSNASVSIDDIIVMPQQSVVGTQTYLPFKGVTSQTDDRGYSTTATYDVRGRQLNLYDRQRNLVEANEYLSKGATVDKLVSASFTTTDVTAGTPFTATASSFNCSGTPTYQWVLDGSNVGTSSTLTTTISSPGLHILALTVTNFGISRTITDDLCVAVNSSVPTFSFSNSTTGNKFCSNENPVITFTVTPTTFCSGVSVSTIAKWEISRNGGAYTTLSSTGNTLNHQNGYSPPNPTGYYTIRVTVQQTCNGGQGLECNGSTIKATTRSVRIDYSNAYPECI